MSIPCTPAARLDICLQGVLGCHRFDGFEAALKTASQEIADTAEALAKPQRPATSSQLLATRSEAAKDHLKASVMVSAVHSHDKLQAGHASVAGNLTMASGWV